LRFEISEVRNQKSEEGGVGGMEHGWRGGDEFAQIRKIGSTQKKLMLFSMFCKQNLGV